MTSPELEQILQILGSPSAAEKIMDKLARAWAQGWLQSQRYATGDPKVDAVNPYLPVGRALNKDGTGFGRGHG